MRFFVNSSKRDHTRLVDSAFVPSLAQAVSDFNKGGEMILPIHAIDSYDFPDCPSVDQLRDPRLEQDCDKYSAAAYERYYQPETKSDLEVKTESKSDVKPDVEPSNPEGAQ